MAARLKGRITKGNGGAGRRMRQRKMTEMAGVRIVRPRRDLAKKRPSITTVPETARRGAAQRMAEHWGRPLEAAGAALEIYADPDKGRCVRAVQRVRAGGFVCEYAGDLLAGQEAITARERERERENAGQSEPPPCYMYYFKFKGTAYCVDASTTTDLERYGFGRLINHSQFGNLVTLCVGVRTPEGETVPKLAFFAARDIAAGEELLYDYGDRSATDAYPWLKG